jgi:prophage regulatory protein
MKRILRRPAVEDRTGLCKSAIYLMQKQGGFPHSVSIAGTRAKGWWEHDIEAWLTNLDENTMPKKKTR